MFNCYCLSFMRVTLRMTDLPPLPTFSGVNDAQWVCQREVTASPHLRCEKMAPSHSAVQPYGHRIWRHTRPYATELDISIVFFCCFFWGGNFPFKGVIFPLLTHTYSNIVHTYAMHTQMHALFPHNNQYRRQYG